MQLIKVLARNFTKIDSYRKVFMAVFIGICYRLCQSIVSGVVCVYEIFAGILHKRCFNFSAICLFVKQKAADISGLSEETKESLEMRFDPCVRESKRTTVMCLAFVPGNLAINDAASVWCGMGSGAIMIYETDKWNCVSEIR